MFGLRSVTPPGPRGWWLMAASLGLFFGWLLAFPMGGPLLGALGGSDGGLAPALAFTAGHAAGLLLSGMLLRPGPTLGSLPAAAALACGALTAAAPHLPGPLLGPFLGLLGLAAAPFPAAWGAGLAAWVPQRWRARTVAAGAVGANLLLLAFQLAGPTGPAALYALVPLPVAGAALYLAWWRRARPPRPVRVLVGPAFGQRAQLGLGGFVVAVYLVGGVLYGAIQPYYASIAGATALGLLPYLAGAALAGIVADRAGRRPVGIAAPSVLGLAFPLFLLDRDRQAWAAVQAPVMLGFGLADVYFWAVLADVGSLYGGLKSFGFGLGLMVAAIGAGMWAVGQLAAGPDVRLGAAAVATAAIFLGAPLGAAVPETLGQVRAVVLPPEKLVFRLATFGLTERELDVARHLLAGTEFNEIAARLGVSKNTLKSHVRNIYAKTGARSRHELILAALRAEELSEA